MDNESPARPATDQRIIVARGLKWQAVRLRKLYVREQDGVRSVSLADVWVAAGLRGDLFALAFDFIDEHGVAASQWGQPRLDGALFMKGWLDIDTLEIRWDAEDEVPDHWRMKRVATIVAVEAGARQRGRGRRSGVQTSTRVDAGSVAGVDGIAARRSGTGG